MLAGDHCARFMDEPGRLVAPSLRPDDPIGIGAGGPVGEVRSPVPFGREFLVALAGYHEIAGLSIGVAVISAGVGTSSFEMALDLANESETPRLRTEEMPFMGFDETIVVGLYGSHGSLFKEGGDGLQAARSDGWDGVGEGSTGAARRGAPPVPQEAAIPLALVRRCGTVAGDGQAIGEGRWKCRR